MGCCRFQPDALGMLALGRQHPTGPAPRSGCKVPESLPNPFQILNPAPFGAHNPAPWRWGSLPQASHQLTRPHWHTSLQFLGNQDLRKYKLTPRGETGLGGRQRWALRLLLIRAARSAPPSQPGELSSSGISQ